MGRRQESVDPIDDHTSSSTWGNHPPREMQMHEREVCQQPLQVYESWIDVHRSLWMFRHEDCKNKSVDVNDDRCNDQDDDDDVDDDES